MCLRRGVMRSLPACVDELCDKGDLVEGMAGGGERASITAASAAYLNIPVERTAPSVVFSRCGGAQGPPLTGGVMPHQFGEAAVGRNFDDAPGCWGAVKAASRSG
jgi:hypothetical protein